MSSGGGPSIDIDDVQELKEEKRFYIILPKKVDVSEMPRPHVMEHGRLMAQCIHLGRVIEHRRAKSIAFWHDVTTITLAVPNSRALAKVWRDLDDISENEALQWAGDALPIFTYLDHNPQVYGTDSRVLTALGVGPIEKSIIEEAIGHLELY